MSAGSLRAIVETAAVIEARTVEDAKRPALNVESTGDRIAELQASVAMLARMVGTLVEHVREVKP